MDYTIQQGMAKRVFGEPSSRAVVPPRRTGQLRRGGGRRDSAGWTEQKRRTNRDRFNLLRPHLRTAVTITYPDRATPDQLVTFSKCCQNFCKEFKIAARCVWEGFGPHQHIGLGIAHDAVIEAKWIARLSGVWTKKFDEEMPQRAFLWNPDVEPDKIASYLLKTRDKQRRVVKGQFPWLAFNPMWENGFRSLTKATQLQVAPMPDPRKTRVDCKTSCATKTEPHSLSPNYTGSSPENRSEPAQVECLVCRLRWAKSLWQNHCVCTGHVTL